MKREILIIGEELVDRLAGAELALFVASRSDYVTFLLEAPDRLAVHGRAMPPVHLWIQTRVGPKSQQFVLFGNQPPPWPEPELSPPSDRMEKAKIVEQLPGPLPNAAPSSQGS